MEQKEFEHIAKNLRMTALHAARRIVGETDAEDIAGDTMLKLWGVHDDISGGKTEATRLAYVMAYHAAIDLCRQRDSRRTIRIDSVEGHIGAAEETRPDRMLEGEEDYYHRVVRITDTVAKLGPMFGLLGTLIPLGPGVVALGQGDTVTLSQSMIIAFDTTIAGIITAAVCALISTFRKRWYASDIADLEAIMEGCLQEMKEAER